MQWGSQVERTLPPEKGVGRKKCFGVKNLKTLKVGPLFVSVSSELIIIEPPTTDQAYMVRAYMLPLKREKSHKKRGATGVLDVWLQLTA